MVSFAANALTITCGFNSTSSGCTNTKIITKFFFLSFSYLNLEFWYFFFGSHGYTTHGDTSHAEQFMRCSPFMINYALDGYILPFSAVVCRLAQCLHEFKLSMVYSINNNNEWMNSICVYPFLVQTHCSCSCRFPWVFRQFRTGMPIYPVLFRWHRLRWRLVIRPFVVRPLHIVAPNCALFAANSKYD